MPGRNTPVHILVPLVGGSKFLYTWGIGVSRILLFLKVPGQGVILLRDIQERPELYESAI